MELIKIVISTFDNVQLYQPELTE